MPKRKRSNKKISGFGALKKESQSNSTKNLKNNQLKENEAMSCIQKGNINEAEKIYLELIERETQSHIVYGNLAAIYQMKGNKEKEQISICRNFNYNNNFHTRTLNWICFTLCDSSRKSYCKSKICKCSEK